MDFLTKIWAAVRSLLIWIDSIGFAFVDNVYALMIQCMSGFSEETVSNLIDGVINNAYVIVGIFALFRLALSLVNSIISPDKLTEEKKGFGNILIKVVITMVLFIVVPIIFQKSRDLQQMIVNNNYISKLLAGVELYDPDATEGVSYNPGTLMQVVTIKSLIKPDDRLFPNNKSCEGEACKTFYGERDCSAPASGYSPSQEAVRVCEHWNDNYVKFSQLSHDIAVYDKVGDEKIFVYNYIPIVTLVVGILILYVLLSFTIDIAVRSVELFALEILSPFFIVTYIDPSSASNGPFKRWLTATGKSYISLFVKIAIITLMLVLISNLGDLLKGIKGDTVFLKLLMILAILIFAKKAPKWIGDMIGLSDGAGLGGLGIGKKLAGAALVGGMLGKGVDKLKSTTKGIGRGAAAVAATHANNALRNRREIKKQKEEKGLTFKDRQAAKQEYIKKNGSAEGFRSAWQKKRSDAKLGFKDKAKMYGAGALGGVATGFKAGFKADKLTGALKGGITASNQFADRQGLGGKSIVEKAKNLANKPYEAIMGSAYGSEKDRFDAREEQAKIATRDEWYTEAGLEAMKGNAPNGRYNKNLAAGFGGFVKATTDENGIRATKVDDAYAMIRACAEGRKATFDSQGNLHIDGISDLDKYKEVARTYFNDDGAAHIEEMVNKQQTSVISEYQSLDEYIGRANQTLMSINQNTKLIMSSKPEVKADPNTGNLYIPGENGKQIYVDPTDIDKTITTLQSEIGKTTDIGVRANLNSYLSFLQGDSTLNSYKASKAQTESLLENSLARKDTLQLSYDRIGEEIQQTKKDANGNDVLDAMGQPVKIPLTPQQKTDYVNNNASKIAKQIEGLKKANNNDKK